MAPYDGRSILDDETDLEPRDREISLSPGIVLGVFFALALVCAVFFGFGYSVGRRSEPAATAVIPSPTLTPATGSKPSPGSFASSAKAERVTAPDRESDTADTQPTPPARSDIGTARRSQPAPSSLSDSIGSGAEAQPATRSQGNWHPPSVVAPVAPSQNVQPLAGSGAIVQVAAFSHQQDAELVAGALRKRGYDVSIRPQPQDSLLHVQLGPFASKKEADAMRQRLQADGYNAIVK